MSKVCNPSDRPCSKEGDVCYENALAGVCQQGANGLECYERSDECPVDSGCTRTESRRSFSGEMMPMELIGECNANYQCQLSNFNCSSIAMEPLSCAVDGVIGQCISISEKQQNAFEKCLKEDEEDTSFCYENYVCKLNLAVFFILIELNFFSKFSLSCNMSSQW